MEQYSTTEIDTKQKWHDGRTIYAKVISRTGAESTGQFTFPHGITDLDRMIELRGIVRRSDDGDLPLPFVSPVLSWAVALSRKDDNILVNIGTSWNNPHLEDLEVVMFYVKVEN